MNEYPWIGVIIICLITFFDFFVALAKSAFEHVNNTKLEEDAEISEEEAAGQSMRVSPETAKRALRFIDEKSRSFYNSCWLIRGIAWISIGMIYCSGPVRELFDRLNGLLADGIDDSWRVIIVTVICVFSTVALIFFEVLFSYILPDRLGNRNTQPLFYRMFGFMRFITGFFRPLSALLEGGCALLIAPFGIKLEDLEANVTEEEIISLVNEGQESGVIDDNEAEMISNIINFDETKTKDIMTHRTKIVAVDSAMSIEEAMRFMAGEAFSRFPLYTDDIDNIIGVIHLKDVAICYSNGDYKTKTLKNIARKPFFVPETMTIDALFNQMQAKKTHMAIAVDEYGQTAGIVAMEDILEEIVGEIEDEFDNEEQIIIKAKDGSYILRGEADLNAVADETGFDINDNDLETFSTVNGLLISLIGRIPADGERESVAYGDYVFDILESKGKMVRKCRMRRKKE
ncbi:MAG: CBS domain-containing protein [Lachnospiraceae bacterium]|nr:CBS domain-containing protein [Lachnospiraceae bacterium]